MNVTLMFGESVVALPGVASFEAARGLQARPKA